MFFLHASVFFISVLLQLVLTLLLASRRGLYVTFSLGCVQEPFSPSSSDFVPHFHYSPVFGFCVGARCHSMFTGLHGVSAASLVITKSARRGFYSFRQERGGERMIRNLMLRMYWSCSCDSRYFSILNIYHLLKAKSASPQPLEHLDVCTAVPFS